MKTQLKLDWATHEAARYACENWHYSKNLPLGKSVRIGAWEDGRFVGVVVFHTGVSYRLGNFLGLNQMQVCELIRVAFTKRKTPISRMLKIAVSMLKKQSPNLRAVVSFADPEQKHYGGIYQASNWIYCGRSHAAQEFFIDNKWRNFKVFAQKRGWSKYQKVDRSSLPKRNHWKYKYVLALDEETKSKLIKLSKPYPKCVSSIASDAIPNQGIEGGANPTDTLHNTLKIS